MLLALMVGCTSYEPGKHPLTSEEYEYFSKIDHKNIVITALGENTFDIYHPTVHSAVLLGSDRIKEFPAIPFSIDRYVDIFFNDAEWQITHNTAILETCRSIGLEGNQSEWSTVGEFTTRFECLNVDQWVNDKGLGLLKSDCDAPWRSKYDHYNENGPMYRFHPCELPSINRYSGLYYSPQSFYCDAFSVKFARIGDDFSCRDLRSIFKQQGKANQQRQERIGSAEQCRTFGFTDNTPEMANCLLELYKIANQPPQNTAQNPPPARNSAPNASSAIDLMNRGLQILNGAGTRSAPNSTATSCTKIGDFSGQVFTFNSIACPAGYAPAY